MTQGRLCWLKRLSEPQTADWRHLQTAVRWFKTVQRTRTEQQPASLCTVMCIQTSSRLNDWTVDQRTLLWEELIHNTWVSFPKPPESCRIQTNKQLWELNHRSLNLSSTAGECVQKISKEIMYKKQAMHLYNLRRRLPAWCSHIFPLLEQS